MSEHNQRKEEMPILARLLALVLITVSCNNDISEYYEKNHNHQPTQDPNLFLEDSPPECMDEIWYNAIATSFPIQPQGWEEICVEARYQTSITLYSVSDNQVPNGCLPYEAVITYHKNGKVIATNTRDRLTGTNYREFDVAGRETLDIYDYGRHVEKASYTTEGKTASESWDDDEDGIIRGTKSNLFNFDLFLDEQGVAVDKNGYRDEWCGRRIEVEWPNSDTLLPPPPPPILDECTVEVVAKSGSKHFTGDFFPPNEYIAESRYGYWTIKNLDEKDRATFIGEYRTDYTDPQVAHLMKSQEFVYDSSGELIAENTDLNGDGTNESQLTFEYMSDWNGAKTTIVYEVIGEAVSAKPQKIAALQTINGRLVLLETYKDWHKDRCVRPTDVSDFHQILPCLVGKYTYSPSWQYAREYDDAARPIQASIRTNGYGGYSEKDRIELSEEVTWTYDGLRLKQRSYMVPDVVNSMKFLYREAGQHIGETFFEYDGAGNVTRELYGGSAGVAREWLDIRRHCQRTTVQQQ